MNARMEFVDFNKAAPEARAALSALSKAVDDSGLEKPLVELIKIRASQNQRLHLLRAVSPECGAQG
jgi:alkylhydroperoxidase family enzyme